MEIVFGGLAVLAIAGLVTWVGKQLAGAGKRPDFMLRRRADRWELERTRWRTAYDVRQGHMVDSGTLKQFLRLQNPPSIGDFVRGQILPIVMSEDGRIWLAWIDGKRKFCRAIDVKDGVDEYPVLAGKATREGHIDL